MPPPFDIRSRNDKEIKDLRGWGANAAPSPKSNWKKGHPSQELARYWLSEMGPGALSMVLDRHPGTTDFKPKRGVAGAQTKFDDFGGPRTHDLLLSGEARAGQTVVALDGKGDEGFGQTLGDYREAFTRKVAKRQNTKAPQRMRGLTVGLAGWEAGAGASRLNLRYALFTGVAGALAAAVDQEADQAVFCVHELVTKNSDEKKRKQNDDDLRRFLDVVFDARPKAADDGSWLVGPLRVHGSTDRMPSSMPLYIAKLCTPPA